MPCGSCHSQKRRPWSHRRLLSLRSLLLPSKLLLRSKSLRSLLLPSRLLRSRLLPSKSLRPKSFRLQSLPSKSLQSKSFRLQSLPSRLLRLRLLLRLFAMCSCHPRCLLSQWRPSQKFTIPSRSQHSAKRPSRARSLSANLRSQLFATR
jgi:hypothetical protein